MLPTEHNTEFCILAQRPPVHIILENEREKQLGDHYVLYKTFSMSSPSTAKKKKKKIGEEREEMSRQ